MAVGFIVTADRIYRVLTGSKDPERIRLTSHFTELVSGDPITSG